jgi:hypothetical protein
MRGLEPLIYFVHMRMKLLFNLYSILLTALLICLIVVFMFFIYQKHFWLPIILFFIIAYLVKPITFMFSQTNTKIRTYQILINRNKNEFNESSFKTHLDTPCSRIVVRKVLKDLSNNDKYPKLKEKYKTSFFRKKTQNKTVVYKK